MAFYIIGDVHGQWNFLNHLLYYTIDLNSPEPWVALQLGDFGYFPKLGYDPSYTVSVPKRGLLYFIGGNHDDHSILKKLSKPTEIGDRIVYLPFGSTLDIEGKSVLTLGGGYSPDKGLRHEGFDWFPNENIQKWEYDSLKDSLFQRQFDIVASHEVPDFLIPEVLYRDEPVIKEQTSKYLGDIFTRFAMNQKWPKSWYAGHFHRRLNRRVSRTDFHIINEIQCQDRRECFVKIDV